MTRHMALPLDGLSLPASYRWHVIETPSALEAFADDWRALEKVAEGGTLFQGAAWGRLAARHLEDGGAGGLYVVVVEADGVPGSRPVAVLPLRIWRRGRRRILTGLAEPFQQYTEMLLHPGVSPEAVWPLVEEALRGSAADYVHLGQVRTGGPLQRAMGGSVAAVADVAGAPVIALDHWPDFESYHASVNAKTRKNLRNARNKLKRRGELAHRVVTGGAELAEVISRTCEGRAAWLDQLGLPSRAFDDASFDAFIERLKDPARSGIETVAMSLTLDGVPIAEQWGFVHQGCYYAYISNWNTAFEDSSPGKLHLGDVIEACYGLGLERVDFIIPAVGYKLTWADTVDEVRDYAMPLSPLGRLYTDGWLRRVRPGLKRVASAMPQGLRKTIVNALLRR